MKLDGTDRFVDIIQYICLLESRDRFVPVDEINLLVIFIFMEAADFEIWDLFVQLGTVILGKLNRVSRYLHCAYIGCIYILEQEQIFGYISQNQGVSAYLY